MKLFTTVLGCTLSACLALSHSGVALSASEPGLATSAPKKAVAKKVVKKKTKKARKTAKRRVIVAPVAAAPAGVPIPALPAVVSAPSSPSPALPQVAVSVAPAPAVSLKPVAVLPSTTIPAATAPVVSAPVAKALPEAAQGNPYLPSTAAPVVTKPNPYLPGTTVAVSPRPAAPPAQTQPGYVYKSPFSPAEAIARAAPATVATKPAEPATAPASRQVNPYLVNSMAMAQTSYAPTAASASVLPSMPSMPGFPELSSLGIPAVGTDVNKILGGLREFLPDLHLPSADIDVLPSITKVYPTGDRPMYVLTFKCPTELVGVTPPPTKALRWLIDSGMEAINNTNVLPFSMQQVCQ